MSVGVGVRLGVGDGLGVGVGVKVEVGAKTYIPSTFLSRLKYKCLVTKKLNANILTNTKLNEITNLIAAIVPT